LGGSRAIQSRELPQLGGSHRIYAGEERFRALCVPMVCIGKRSEKASPLKMCFSAGHFGASPSSSSTEKHGPSIPISNLGHHLVFPCLAEASLDCHTGNGLPCGRAAVHPAAQFLLQGSNGGNYSERWSCGSRHLRADRFDRLQAEMSRSHKCFSGGRSFSSDIESPVESRALAPEETQSGCRHYLCCEFISGTWTHPVRFLDSSGQGNTRREIDRSVIKSSFGRQKLSLLGPVSNRDIRRVTCLVCSSSVRC